VRFDFVSPLFHSFRDQIHFMEATIPEPRFEAMYGLVHPKLQTRNTKEETRNLKSQPQTPNRNQVHAGLAFSVAMNIAGRSLPLFLSLTLTHTFSLYILPGKPLRCVSMHIAGDCQRQHRIFCSSLNATCPLTPQTNAPTSSRRCR
jgi:hypothetical protein